MSETVSFVGIDPGTYGGIAICERCATTTDVLYSWSLFSLPLIETKKNRFDLDLVKVLTFIKKRNQLSKFIKVAIEDPPYIPGNGGFAIRSLFKNYGELRGLITSIDASMICVAPKSWQKVILPGKKAGKEAAISYVQTTYPALELPNHPKHPEKFHDGLADAICLVDYAKREYFATGGL